MNKPGDFTLIFCGEVNVPGGATVDTQCFYCNKKLVIEPTTVQRVEMDCLLAGVPCNPRPVCGTCGKKVVLEMKTRGDEIEIRFLGEKQAKRLEEFKRKIGVSSFDPGMN